MEQSLQNSAKNETPLVQTKPEFRLTTSRLQAFDEMMETPDVDFKGHIKKERPAKLVSPYEDLDPSQPLTSQSFTELVTGEVKRQSRKNSPEITNRRNPVAVVPSSHSMRKSSRSFADWVNMRLNYPDAA